VSVRSYIEIGMRYRGTSRAEALQFTGNFEEIEAFVGGDCEWRKDHLVVATRQGALRVGRDEWIVRDVRGHFAAYPPHLFADAFRLPEGGKGDAT
jgi:hypothetical protein